MDRVHLFLALLLPALLALSACCSGAETALFSLRRADKVRLRKLDPGAADLAARMLEAPRALIIAILLANIAVNTAYMAVGVVLARSLEGPLLTGLVGVAVPLALIVLGEVVPKALAGVHPVRIARILARPVFAWSRLVSPLRHFLDRFVVAPLARLFRPAGAARDPQPISVRELQLLLEHGAGRGVIDAEEHRLLAEVVDLGNIRVRDVMIPRIDVEWLDEGDGPERVLDLVRTSGRRKFPVFHGDPDEGKVLGVLSLKRYLSAMERRGQPPRLADHLDPARFVPERARLDQLIDFFHQHRCHVALVVSEEGSLVGLVEIESAVRHLLQASGGPGPEHDEEVQRVAEGEWLVSGRLSVREWGEFFGGATAHGAIAKKTVSTLAGLILAQLGRLPQRGEELRIGDVLLRVEELDGASIEKVRVRLAAGEVAP